MVERNAEECQQRFVMLSNRFVTEKRRVAALNASSAGGGVELYDLYKKILFLLGFIKSRHTTSNVQRSSCAASAEGHPPLEIEGHPSHDGGEEEDADVGHSNVWGVMPHITEAQQSQGNSGEVNINIITLEELAESREAPSTSRETPSTSIPQQTAFLRAAETRGKKRKAATSLEDVLQTSLGTLEDYLKKKGEEKGNLEEVDSDISFGRMIGLHLKDMPPEQKKKKTKYF
ncbi:uncharacterized protein LOC116182345 isoform X1 [Photinus pyralis]|uniref:uncharacterized protein LOC116166001 isoform X1 n=1 Tax=Photinus pyralis TaxID=7054 RepID=UPI0012671C76|nr:uncharacterized protein LOC116166001 isoform X1 [Photinus pyralis]XP_031358734.1 uncharacterized protein LOC116182345 isoform X1 [Photinus pyralis]